MDIIEQVELETKKAIAHAILVWLDENEVSSDISEFEVSWDAQWRCFAEFPVNGIYQKIPLKNFNGLHVSRVYIVDVNKV
jgi:hypothetical protein